MIFEEAVAKYFRDDLYTNYCEDSTAKTISFDILSSEIEFDKLDSLSRILGTKLINFHQVNQEYGYCESCGGTNTFITVHCSGVRFDDSDPIIDKCEIIEGELEYTRDY